LSSLRLRTFGGLAIERDGSPVSGAGAQRRPLALLALLAAAGERGITRAKAVGLLWPDSDDEKARRVLAQTLYSIRRDLGGDIVAGTTELRLHPESIDCDLREFTGAIERGDSRTAASVYAGPFLDGFHLPGAPEFERWADESRRAFAHRYIATLERLADETARAGCAEDEVSCCRRLAAADPLSARHAIRLMDALARAGDRSGALQHARVHEALLRAELDVDPDPEVVKLVARLRAESCATTAPRAVANDARGRSSLELEGVGATQEWLVRLAAGLAASRTGAAATPRSTADAAGAPAMSASRTSGASVAASRGSGGRRWRWVGLAVLVVASVAALALANAATIQLREAAEQSASAPTVIDVEAAPANVELARAYLEMNRPGDALAVLRALQRMPSDAMAPYATRSEIDFLMARAFSALGNADSARVYLARVRESWQDADPEIGRMIDRRTSELPPTRRPHASDQ
jgi:DNA-binding SARP family transcriptional activator